MDEKSDVRGMPLKREHRDKSFLNEGPGPKSHATPEIFKPRHELENRPFRPQQESQEDSKKEWIACPTESKQFLECLERNSGQTSNCQDILGNLINCARVHKQTY
jgi:hypothetical protein